MYTISFNRRKKTYTIRRYRGGEVVEKFRSHPQSVNYHEDGWDEDEIKKFLETLDYYRV